MQFGTQWHIETTTKALKETSNVMAAASFERSIKDKQSRSQALLVVDGIPVLSPELRRPEKGTPCVMNRHHTSRISTHVSLITASFI